MPSKPTGSKTITNIKILKLKVVITFDDDTRLEISPDTYTGFYLFVGKKLSQKDIGKIKKIDVTNTNLRYAISICSRSIMTEGKLKDKLYARKVDKEIIEDILKILKANDLISDEGFIMDYLEYSNEKLLGENKIKANLVNKGVPFEKVNKIKFSKTNEANKAKQVIEKIAPKYEKYTYVIKKRKIYQALLSKGFASDIATNAVLRLKNNDNDYLVSKEINRSTTAWMRANEAKYPSDKERFNAFHAYMKRKGYSYSRIKKGWSDYYGNID